MKTHNKKASRMYHRFEVTGTGFATLDLIFPCEFDLVPLVAAGGTCANILLILAQLGLTVNFLARLGEDAAGKQISASFQKAGVNVSPVFHDHTIASPVMLQYCRQLSCGKREHWFSRDYNGRRLPDYVSITNDQVQSSASTLTRSGVFIFDRLTPETLNAAQTAHEGGALVVFEPSAIEDSTLFFHALALVNILKFSCQRLGGKIPQIWLANVPVVIQTLGEKGLEVYFRDRSDSPRFLPAIDAPRVVDTCGSGDMVTAGLLYWLWVQGNQDPQTILQGLQKGQQLAAMNCAFLGARGLFHAIDVVQIKKTLMETHMKPWGQKILALTPMAGYCLREADSIFLS